MKTVSLYLVLCIALPISTAAVTATRGPSPTASWTNSKASSSTTSMRTYTSTAATSPAPHFNYTERQCACTPSKLYLDIVVVIDNSLSMTREGLIEVAADLATLFQSMTIGGTKTGQFIRVALVTFADKAAVYADFDKYNDYEALIEALFTITYNPVQKLNIEAGLQEASKLIEGSRSYAKSVVLLYSSAYSAGGFADPTAIANQLKESGTKIITVAFHQQPEGALVKKLGRLASSNYTFGSKDRNIIQQIINAFCQVNCYCRDNWVQFANSFEDPHLFYGECLRFMDIDANWYAAHFACPAMVDGAYLASEFSAHKHTFIAKYAQSAMSTLSWPFEYHIGLRYKRQNKSYSWDGPDRSEIPFGSAQLPFWNVGFPNVKDGECVSVVSGGLQNENCLRKPMRYVCQVAACDTDNFCASPSD